MFARNGSTRQRLVLALAVLGAGYFVASVFAQGGNGNPGQSGTPKKIKPAQKALQGLISFEVTQPAPAKPGEVVTYTVKGKLKPEFYTYPITKKAPGQGQGTLLTVAATKEVQPLWPIKEKEPEFHYNDALNEVSLHVNGELVWSQDVFIKPDAKPGEMELPVKVNLQICKTSCFGPDEYPDPILVKIKVLDAPAVAVTPEIEKRLKQTDSPKAEVVTLPKEWAAKIKKEDKVPGALGTTGTKTTGTDPALSAGLVGLLGSAFFGAILMLLTPCVFPMIPITVNFFLKQSEKEHHNALFTALVYSGTIIFLLTVIMLAFGSVVIEWATDPWFNLLLGAALIFFALSLFGMYEIELPSGLARFTSAREGQGGYFGAIFMALTFTITSFTCTGPFLGMMMAPIAAFQVPYWQLVLAALVYATTFAAPFFLLALFPSWLKRLPKSGGWLNSIKVTMGFLEIGAALKFLANTDGAFSPGNPLFLNNDTVLCAWIALSVATGFYLFGLFRLPHDDAVEKIGVLRMMFAAFFIGFALYLTPLLFGKKPDGLISQNVVAFLPQPFKSAATQIGSSHDSLVWHKDARKAWEIAQKENKYIFIDFTGVTCANCRDNEENVFPLARVQNELKQYVLLQLYTDWVPLPGLSRTEATKLGMKNKEYQGEMVTPALPTYAIYKPDPNVPLGSDPEFEKSLILGTKEGRIDDIDGFVEFLRRPLQEQKVAKKLELDWNQDYQTAWKQADKEGRLLLVHFSAVSSVYARYNEGSVYQHPSVAEQLKRFVRVQLYIDKVPGGGLSAQESDVQAKRNHDWLAGMGFGWAPAVVIVKPNKGATKGADGLPDATVVEKSMGMITDIPPFVSLLKKAAAGTP